MKKLPDDIKALENKIEQLRSREYRKQNISSRLEQNGTLALGLRIAVELLSAVIVGASIGFVLDRFFSTYPLFFSAFLLFGGAAGFLNVYRMAKAYQDEKTEETK